MKNNKKFLCLFGIILAAVSAVGRAFINIKKTDIIVSNGIAGFRIFRTTANIGLILGVIVATIGIVILLKHQRTERAERKQIEEVEMSRRQKKKSYSPEDVRVIIAELHQKYPDFPLDRCVMQLDQMDNYQSRLKELLDNNDLEAFAYTEGILKDLETELCRDIKSFTNYMIVSDDPNVVLNRYNSLLSHNEERFTYVQNLLITLADFVNENIKSEDAVEKIKFCNDAIRDTFNIF